MEAENEYLIASANENSLPTPELWCALKEVSCSVHVRKVTEGFDRPLQDSDFKDTAAQVEKSIVILHDRLQNIIDSCAVDCITRLDENIRSFLVSSLIVCGEQSNEEIWTTCVSVQSAWNILNLLCKIFRVSTSDIFGELESKWKVDICRLMLIELKPKLRKTTWKQYPASFTCYRWILMHSKTLQISENFEEFVLPALVAVDDYEICNQVKGVNCLTQVISNVTRTDLCHLGFDDLIFNALEHLLYVKEPDIILCLIPCLSLFLQKVEKGYTNKEDDLQFTRYDKALKIFLGNMEMEQYLKRRKAYVEVLPLLLDSMGLPMLRWSKRLLRILEDYLLVDDASNGLSTLKTLKAVKVYLLHTWPLISRNLDGLLESLLKLSIEMTDLDPSREISFETSEAILCLLEECLCLIMKISDSRAKELCFGINSASFNTKFDEIINRLFLSN